MSLERSSVGVVDGGDEIVVEAKVTSEPAALVASLRAQPFGLARIGLEAGPLSPWLFAGLRDAGFAAELLETDTKGRARDRAADAPRLVRAGARQVAGCAGDPGALLAARAELLRWFKDLEKRLVAVGHDDERVRRLTTVPGVGNLVALTFVAAIDDPTRF